MTTCAVLLVLSYVIFGVLGMVLEWRLTRATGGLPAPVTEDRVTTDEARRLFRLHALWAKSRIPVWIGLIVLGAVICRK